MSFADPSRFLEELFRAAVTAANPADRIAEHLPARPPGRTIVVGAGKAGAAMAAAVEQAWDGPLEGLATHPDQIVISAGMPFGTPGATNLLRIATVPEPLGSAAANS